MAAATLELGGLLFSGRRGSSTRFYFRGLVDWSALSDSKAKVVERPQDHGAFGIGANKRTSLAPSFEGFYSGTSRLDALNAQKTLKALAANEGMLTATLTDEDGAWSRQVSLRRIDMPDVRWQRAFTFHVYMVAPDPRLYGAPVVVSNGLPVSAGGLTWPITWPLTWGAGGNDGRVTVSNSGTADTFSDLQVSGGLGGGFLLESGSRQIKFEREIPLGSTVFVNQRTGRAYIDTVSSDVSGYLTRTDWIPVPAGGSAVIQFNSIGAVTGTPTLTATTSPANW